MSRPEVDLIAGLVLLRKEDVCAKLALSPRTIESLVASGEFPPAVRIGKRVYWSERAIAGWLERMFGAQEAWGRPLSRELGATKATDSATRRR